MNQRGFTLPELLIVLVLFAILFLISGTFASQTLSTNQVVVHADMVEEKLRRAQARTISGAQDSVWGVHLTGSDVTLFAGATYAGRDTALDELYTFDNGVTASGITDVVFEVRTGKTSDTGSITLTHAASGQTKTLTVNSQGRVE